MKKMKLLLAGLLTFALFLQCAGCGGDSGSAEDPGDSGSSGEAQYVWNLGNICTDPASVSDYNSWGVAIQKFADLVDEYTEGQVKIVPQWNSVLGGAPSLLEQVKMGELECFFGQPMSSIDSRFACFNIPYTFTEYAELEAAVAPDSPLYALSSQWMEENGAILLGMGPSAFRGIATNKHEVRVPSDCKDLVMRVYEDSMVMEFWSGLCTTSTISGSEIFSALQTKTVDAFEFHSTGIVKGHYEEVIDYFTDLNWQWCESAVLVVGEKYWNELPDDLKEAVQKAATEACAYQGELEVEFDEASYGAMEEAGITVTYLTDDEMQEWVDYARSLDGKFAEFVGQDVFDEYMAAVDAVKQSVQ